MHANAKFDATCHGISQGAQHRSWRRRLLGLRASARCGRADKACRRRNAVRTATSKEWSDSDQQRPLIRIDPKLPCNSYLSVFWTIRSALVPFFFSTYIFSYHLLVSDPPFQRAWSLHVWCLGSLGRALYHCIPRCLGSVVKRATKRSRSPTPGSLGTAGEEKNIFRHLRSI